MKFRYVLLITLLPLCATSQVKVNALPNGSSISSGDFTICDQGGVTNKCTFSQVSTWTRSQTTKSDVGLGNVENTALSTWGGSANLTTLGTISTGVWAGTIVGVTKGGTGLSSGTLNGIPYFDTPTHISTSSSLTFDGTNLSVGGNNVQTILSGTTAAIGGSSLLAGQCAAGTATVTGATTSMVSAASPSADPDNVLTTGIAFYSFVSSTNTVTVRVCAIVAVTPASVPYNVRVFN